MLTSQARLFGRKLRIARVTAEKNLDQVAQHLGVSISFLSDIERGARPPLSQERIAEVAAYFNIDANDLQRAALVTKGAALINVPDAASDSQLRALNRLARGGLSEATWEQIDKLLNNGDK